MEPFLILGTDDGVWELTPSGAERIGMQGKRICHVAHRANVTLASVPHDGLYLRKDGRFRRIWTGDARACAISPRGVLYVGAEPAMVHWSVDEGKTWNTAEAIDHLPTRDDWYFPPPPHKPHVRSIDFFPGDPETVLVGIEVGGFIVSPDGGISWEEMNEGINVDVHTARPDPSNPRCIYAVTGGGFHASEDGGHTWQHRMEGIDRWYTAGLHVNPAQEGELLVAAGDRPPGRNGRLYHSSDGGNSWGRAKGNGLPGEFESVPVPLFAPGRVYVGTDKGEIFSAKRVEGSWSPAGFVGTPINAMAADGATSSVDSGH
ncbi:MAG: hypothetical protein HY682_10600 [Chloroflexi bacterium]|nr:hypothetical protein [Chloroflexota bacterium]